MKIFHLPDLGEGLQEAEVREWYVKPGDVVTLHQPIASMETAKAVVDVPSPYAGKIITLHGQINEIIQTGAPLVTFETDDEVSVDKGTVVGSLPQQEKSWEEEVIVGTKTRNTSLKVTPAARLLAKELNVNLQLVEPTGPQGLITPEDVKRFSDDDKSVFKGFEAEDLHGVYRVMAKVMSESHREVVNVSIFEDADITNLPKDVSLTVLLIQAITSAIKVEPALNAWFNGKKLQRKVFTELHLGLAVDTPQGLFVPVIKNAENKAADELRNKVDEYKQTVSNRTIQSTDLQGATFTLSNFGTIAGRYATPIIVPPTVAILGSGRIRETPIVKHNQIVVGRVLPLSLTFDHRAVTGGEATRFLGEVVRYIQGVTTSLS